MGQDGELRRPATHLEAAPRRASSNSRNPKWVVFFDDPEERLAESSSRPWPTAGLGEQLLFGSFRAMLPKLTYTTKPGACPSSHAGVLANGGHLAARCLGIRYFTEIFAILNQIGW